MHTHIVCMVHVKHVQNVQRLTTMMRFQPSNITFRRIFCRLSTLGIKVKSRVYIHHTFTCNVCQLHTHTSPRKGEGGEFYPDKIDTLHCIYLAFPLNAICHLMIYFIPIIKVCHNMRTCVYIPLCITFFIIYRGISVPC